ncbi:MAG: ATP-dependent DNA helicase [Chromatiales bacterium]|jgi:ATP-dependent DNA helicase DinG|nr:ATP-dependent DNA helicase [Chromatiales bacterium]
MAPPLPALAASAEGAAVHGGLAAALLSVSSSASMTQASLSSMDESISALLGEHGPLAQRLPGFVPRLQQQEMADAIGRVLRRGGMLVAEAGTGTGKTYAYLVPALVAGMKTVVSTGTKALQDQLFHRDIPRLTRALASPVRVALLKGRANYLCLHRLELAERAPELATSEAIVHLHGLREWAQHTESGEIAQFHALPAGDRFWLQVTSTADNCLGQECPSWSECHVVKARRAAQEAELVVVNHHLLFSDFLLRQEGFGELLPAADAFVLDEAHQLPEIASRFFGIAVSGRQLTDLARDAVRAQRGAGGDMPAIEVSARGLERALDGFRRTLGDAQRQAAWEDERAPAAALSRLQTEVRELRGLLEDCAERDPALQHCWRRAQTLAARLDLFAERVDENSEEKVGGAQVKWLESSARSFTLYVTPMDFSATFRAAIDRYSGAWIFTSATLAVGEEFSHFTARLGIEDASTARWGSPFDYARNTLCYLPPDMPDPSARDYTAAVIGAARPVLAASGGRAFLLFTSHSSLREAARLLETQGFEYPLFVQGSLPHQELLERFRAAGNGVLLGTASFWEGVDVRGSALSCVIIDKLPFAAPDDPVLQARAALIRAHGGNPFRDQQLPAAVIALKQGAGRLIRDADDSGVLMLCDPRLRGRSYGRIFLADLPPMPRTSELDDVIRFFQHLDECASAQARTDDVSEKISDEFSRRIPEEVLK